MSLVRQTKASDIALLPEIERSAGQAFLIYPNLSWLADADVMNMAEHRRLRAMNTSWVYDDSPVCGFLCAEAFALEGDATQHARATELHIWELAVAANAQGKGAGTALMRHAMARAKTEFACASLTLTTFRHVAFNAPFYEKLGFVVVEDLMAENRLRQVLAAEAAHGLPTEDRCAMRFEIT